MKVTIEGEFGKDFPKQWEHSGAEYAVMMKDKIEKLLELGVDDDILFRFKKDRRSKVFTISGSHEKG